MRKITARRYLVALGLACAMLAGGPLALAGAAGAAGATGAAPRPADRAPAGPRVPALRWRSCHHGFECATAQVPLDYRRPRGTSISIAVIMHRAPRTVRRPGTLFVNGGGPAPQILPFVADFLAFPPPCAGVSTSSRSTHAASGSARRFAASRQRRPRTGCSARSCRSRCSRSVPGRQARSSARTPGSGRDAPVALACCSITSPPQTWPGT